MAAFTGNSIVGQVVAGDGHVVSSGQHGTVNGVASAQLFGVLAPKTAITRAVAGVLSAQAFGAPSLKTTVTRSVSGLGSAQGFGAITTFIANAPQTKAVSGLGSAQAFGSLTFRTAVSIQVPGVQPPGVSQFGTPTIKSLHTLTPAGIASAQSFGAVTTSARITKLVGGVASAQAFGAAVAKPPPTTVPVTGIGSAQGFGTLAVVWSQIVQVPGLPQQTGLRSIVGGVVSGDGHLVGGTGLQFGFVKLVPGAVTVGVPGLGSAQAFGTPWIAFWQPLPVLGVPSAQQFGTPFVFKVWVRAISCTSLDLARITCTSLTFATGAVTEIVLTAAPQDNLDLTASEAEDLDLQPAGCD